MSPIRFTHDTAASRLMPQMYTDSLAWVSSHSTRGWSRRRWSSMLAGSDRASSSSSSTARTRLGQAREHLGAHAAPVGVRGATDERRGGRLALAQPAAAGEQGAGRARVGLVAEVLELWTSCGRESVCLRGVRRHHALTRRGRSIGDPWEVPRFREIPDTGGSRGAAAFIPCRRSSSATSTPPTNARTRSPPGAGSTARSGTGSRSRAACRAGTRSGGSSTQTASRTRSGSCPST